MTAAKCSGRLLAEEEGEEEEVPILDVSVTWCGNECVYASVSNAGRREGVRKKSSDNNKSPLLKFQR